MADPDRYEFTYPHDAAEQLLYWNADELPARFYEARRQAAIALLDDTYTVWQRHNRTARKVEDVDVGTAWVFKVREEAILCVATSYDGTVFAFQKINRRNVEADLNFQPSFDSAAGRLVGRPILDAHGRPVRDISSPGHPILLTSPIEELISAIMAWGAKVSKYRPDGANQP